MALGFELLSNAFFELHDFKYQFISYILGVFFFLDSCSQTSYMNTVENKLDI